MRRVVVLLLLCACHGGFKNGVFVKDGRAYEVGELPAGWEKLDLEENDLAFASGRHSIAVNSTCKDHGDPPLPVLTHHLLMGFTDREKLAESTEPLDGRDALRSRWKAKLDRHAVELWLVVMKKDGCVYDFTYISPPDQAGDQAATFEQLLRRFHTR
jgi:hypothetical protein